jgi:hypothetical protein
MVPLGADIANYADFASGSLRLIKKMITKMIKLQYNSPEYKKEKFAAQKRLADLQTQAKEMQEKCLVSVNKLTHVSVPGVLFDIHTLADKWASFSLKCSLRTTKRISPRSRSRRTTACLKLRGRPYFVSSSRTFKDPTKPIRSNLRMLRLGLKRTETRDGSVSATSQVLPSLCVMSTNVSVDKIPFYLICVWIWKLFCGSESSESPEDLPNIQKPAQDVNNQMGRIRLAYGQVGDLFAAVEAVGNTIQSALKSVTTMEKTFQTLAACFNSILMRLNLVQSNKDVEYLYEAIINEDLDKAITTWAQVSVYARVFTETGLTPGELTDGESELDEKEESEKEVEVEQHVFGEKEEGWHEDSQLVVSIVE